MADNAPKLSDLIANLVFPAEIVAPHPKCHEDGRSHPCGSERTISQGDVESVKVFLVNLVGQPCNWVPPPVRALYPVGTLLKSCTTPWTGMLALGAAPRLGNLLREATALEPT